LRVAVVGIGKMGLLHASILNFMPDVKLVALCDRSSLILRFAKKIFEPTGVKILKDVDSLSGLDLDVVYVTTPISSHSPIARDLLGKGIARNIFVEKTLASSYDEAKSLCDLVQSHKCVNMVGYMKRFAVTFRKANDLLRGGSLGEVSSFDAYAYSSDFVGLENNSRGAAPRGGALRDLGCHVIDLALWFFGDLGVDSAKLESQDREAPADLVSFGVTSSDGVRGRLSVSRSMEHYRMPEVGLSIVGSEGTLNVTDDKVELKLNTGETSVWHRHDLGDNVAFLLGEAEYFREDQHFVNSVLEGKFAQPDFSTASRVERVIDQVKV
jgi:predicted dehydrogenase